MVKRRENKIISNDGSIQNIEGIPICFKEDTRRMGNFTKRYN